MMFARFPRLRGRPNRSSQVVFLYTGVHTAAEDLAFPALCMFIHRVSPMSLNFLFINAPVSFVRGKQAELIGLL